MAADHRPLTTYAGLRAYLRRRRTANWFKAVNTVGSSVTCIGRPYIVNRSRIEIGDRLVMSSRPITSHIVTFGRGVVTIGNDVVISHGAAISARSHVDIGNGTQLGPYCVVLDSDFHSVANRRASGESAPIRIGAHVTIGARVTIMRGATLGDRCTVLSGSVVSGNVPPGATVGGMPARAVTEQAPSDELPDILDLAQQVLLLAHRPRMTDGPNTLVQWDSLGGLRLLLAIEDEFHVSLGEEEMRTAKNLEHLAAIVERARQAHTQNAQG